MLITDHALIRYIERVHSLSVSDWYKRDTGRSAQRDGDGFIIGWLQRQGIDTNAIKRELSRLFDGVDMSVNRREVIGGYLWVIKGGFIVTVFEKGKSRAKKAGRGKTISKRADRAFGEGAYRNGSRCYEGSASEPD